MYIEGLPYEPFFITLTLKGEIIIEPMKKLVVLYVVGDLVFFDQVYENINTKKWEYCYN